MTPGRWRLPGSRLAWDAVVVAVIFVAGETMGSRYFTAYQRLAPPRFGQNDFGAAVSLACGRGFVDPLPTPALSDFLNLRVDAFSCDQLPADRSPGPGSLTQGLYRYLMTAAALRWRWAGITWSGLDPVFGVAFALTLCVAYGLFRLAAGPWLALAAVVAFATSAHHLEYLPWLRDYAKAPFILGLILLMAHLAIPPFERRRSLVLAGAFGLVLGVGFGFRNDLLINVPPYLLVVLFLLPGRVRDNLRHKVACLALSAALFVIAAWPILTAYRSGSNTGHVMVLGFMSTFDGALRLTRPPYALGAPYADEFAAAVIEIHSRLRTGHVVPYLSGEYDAAAVALLVDLARHWPADIVARAYGAALQVLDFPFTVGRYGVAVPRGITAASQLRFYDWHMAMLRTLSGLGLPLTCVSLVVIGARDVRAAVALAVLLAYYCGAAAIQFDLRHFFQLEVIAWWALVFVVAAAARGLRRAATGPRTFGWELVRGAATGATALLAALAVLVAPLWLARTYQQRHLVEFFTTYLQAHRMPAALSRADSSGIAHLSVDGLWSAADPADRLSVRYLAVEFGADGCGVTNLPVLIKYDAVSPPNDFSALTRITIPPSGRTWRLVPAYRHEPYSHFAGFEIGERDAACLKSVSVIDDLSRIPVLLDLNLAPGWREAPLFQQMVSVDSHPAPDVTALTTPPDLAIPLESRQSRLEPPHFDVVSSGVTRQGAHGWVGKTTASIPQQVLLHSVAQPLPAGSILRLDGVLRHGGLLIGVTTHDVWDVQQIVSEAGPFTVAIRVSEAGPYGILVTDFSSLPWRVEPRSLVRSAVRLVCPVLLSDEFELHDAAWVTPMDGAESQ